MTANPNNQNATSIVTDAMFTPDRLAGMSDSECKKEFTDLLKAGMAAASSKEEYLRRHDLYAHRLGEGVYMNLWRSYRKAYAKRLLEIEVMLQNGVPADCTYEQYRDKLNQNALRVREQDFMKLWSQYQIKHLS